MEVLRQVLKILLGLGILFLFYGIGFGIVKLLHLFIPPAILGLMLFAVALHFKFVKEDWVKPCVDILLNNMAMLFVPFVVGLIAYKSVLFKNWIAILLVILFATAFTILFTGLFVEYGIKYLKLIKARDNHD